MSAASKPIQSAPLSMFISLDCGDRSAFNDIAHEAAGVPVCRSRLHHVRGVGASHHQRVAAFAGKRKIRLPLPEAVFAVVRPEPCRLPGLTAIRRKIDLCDPGIAAECDAPG